MLTLTSPRLHRDAGGPFGWVSSNSLPPRAYGGDTKEPDGEAGPARRTRAEVTLTDAKAQERTGGATSCVCHWPKESLKFAVSSVSVGIDKWQCVMKRGGWRTWSQQITT